MNKRILVFLIVVMQIGLASMSLRAEVRPWLIDADHTNFYFSIDHIYAKVQGRFNEYRGTLIFNPDNLKESKMSFEIKAKSVDTGIGRRDKHLRSADFLDTAKFPLITFTSKSITRAEGNIYNVSGILTIKDVSKEIVLPLVFAGTRENPMAPETEVAGFNGRLTLDRLAYNVGDGKYYHMGVVGKDVEILVTIEALRNK